MISILKNNRKDNKGFALIELILSVAIFLIIISIGLGAVVNLYNTNSKSGSLASVINNLNYSIESMTRDIRFATVYHCGESGTPLTSPQNCDGGDVFLAISTSSSPIIYRFANNRIERSDNLGVSYNPVTSSEINIQYLRFYTKATAVGDEFQSYVTLVIKGFAGTKPSVQSSFNIQTMISQRALNI